MVWQGRHGLQAHWAVLTHVQRLRRVILVAHLELEEHGRPPAWLAIEARREMGRRLRAHVSRKTHRPRRRRGDGVRLATGLDPQHPGEARLGRNLDPRGESAMAATREAKGAADAAHGVVDHVEPHAAAREHVRLGCGGKTR